MPPSGRIERLAIILLASLLGCSSAVSTAGGTVDKPGPALDPGKRLVDLTPAERAALCDWSASMVGGYGTRFYCPGYVYQTHASQAACVESRSRIKTTCTATVADSQACATATQDDPCQATSRESVPPCIGRLKTCFASPLAGTIPKGP